VVDPLVCLTSKKRSISHTPYIGWRRKVPEGVLVTTELVKAKVPEAGGCKSSMKKTREKTTKECWRKPDEDTMSPIS